MSLTTVYGEASTAYEDKTLEAIKAGDPAPSGRARGQRHGGGFRDGAGPVAEQPERGVLALGGGSPMLFVDESPGATSTWWAGSITITRPGGDKGLLVT